MGDAPILYAAFNTNPAALKNGAKIGETNPNRETALGLAAEHATDPQAIAILLAAGAVIEQRNGVDQTPLMIACIYNPRPAIISALLKGHADPGALNNEMMKMTSVHLAAQYGRDPGAITALARAGAAMDAPNFMNQTPLMIAAETNPEPLVVIAFLDAGADATLLDLAGQSAVDYALKNPALNGTEALARLKAAAGQ
jgi:ankyrin repeat protein